MGQTVERAIKHVEEFQSRTSVIMTLTLLPLGWCSTVVVVSEQPQDVSVKTRVEWGGWWAQ